MGFTKACVPDSPMRNSEIKGWFVVRREIKCYNTRAKNVSVAGNIICYCYKCGHSLE